MASPQTQTKSSFTLAPAPLPETERFARLRLARTDRVGPVTFKHSEHIAKHKLACSTCHHGIKTDEEAKACSACHKTEKVEKTPSYKDALHKNCKDCHKKYKEDAAAKGVQLDALPTLCKHCHKKAK